MKGSKILIEANPKGVFKECIISGTPKPGTVMQVKAATEPIGGRHSWEVFNQAADGSAAVIAVLLEKQHEGKIYSDAYADGDRGYLYFPAMGEELNMLVQNQSGTGDAFAIGARLEVDDTTGKLIAEASGEACPFVCMETQAALTADTHVHCMFSGY